VAEYETQTYVYVDSTGDQTEVTYETVTSTVRTGADDVTATYVMTYSVTTVDSVADQV
jgi:hypothetical protein